MASPGWRVLDNLTLLTNASQMLKDVPLAPNFPLRDLAECSRGKSGSDLKELCRNAAMLPVRELVRQAKGDVALLARTQEEVRTRILSVDPSSQTFCTGLRTSSPYN
jgi:SpoVK/Ycf46/Vps4 family AAA+-type ATPase